MLRCMNFDLLLDIGSFEPLNTKKSSSFSFLVKPIINFLGTQIAFSSFPETDPPHAMSNVTTNFLSCSITSLLPLSVISYTSLSAEPISLLWPSLIAIEVSQFLNKINKKNTNHEYNPYVCL